MKKFMLVLAALLVVGTQSVAQEKNSGPLSFVSSDVNPKTLFWIQGRFVPVNDPKSQGDPDVATIFCSAREYECLEIDGTASLQMEQVWIEDFKVISWAKDGIVAGGRSLDGCTDETLKIGLVQPSVVIINSPVLPMSENCKKTNAAWDKLLSEKGQGLKAQTEQDMLVPTRGLLPFQDQNLSFRKASGPSQKKNP